LYLYKNIPEWTSTIILFSCAVPTEQSRDVKQYTIEQFMNNTSIGGGSFSFDHKQVLLTSDQSGIYNVYTIPAEGGNLKILQFLDKYLKAEIAASK